MLSYKERNFINSTVFRNLGNKYFYCLIKINLYKVISYIVIR